MTPLTPQTDLTEKTVASREIFRGNILRVTLDEAQTPSGEVRSREVVEHPGGAVVMGILPDDKFLLIEQFRYPLKHTLFEFPAGKLDPGEAPLTTVQRELEEETGYIAQNWEEVTTIVTSPGFCNERITVFKATGLTLSPNPRREEDEFIQVLAVTSDDIRTMLKEQRLIDAKTICALALIRPDILAGAC